MKTRIKEILESALEKEDDSEGVVKLFQTHIGLLESMIDHELFHSIACWVGDQACGYNALMPDAVLDLASLMPNRFNHCFHYLIIALNSKDMEMLHEMGVSESDIPEMLEWLEKNHPVQFEEAMSIKASLSAQANSAATQEKLENILRGRKNPPISDTDPVS